MKTEFEIDLDDELLEQAFKAAPEGTTLEALIEMSLNAWIHIRSSRHPAFNQNSHEIRR